MSEFWTPFWGALTGGSVAFAAIGFLSKKWLDLQLDKASQKFSHELTKEITKLGIHEQYLHERRVKAVEDIYSLALETEQYYKRFLMAWWGYFQHEKNPKMLKERGLEFCEQYIAINNALIKNVIFFNDEFIGNVRSLYEPLFYLVKDMDKACPPVFPEELEPLIIAVGEQPRLEVIKVFRKTLGVELREN